MSTAEHYELRQYRAKPGRRGELVELMSQEILPFQVSCGVDVVVSFVAIDDPDAYVWIRRWSCDQQRERVSAAVYGSSRWSDELMPAPHSGRDCFGHSHGC